VPSAKPARYSARTHRAHRGNAAHFRHTRPSTRPDYARRPILHRLAEASGRCQASSQPAAQPFNRARYDAARTVTVFAARLKEEIDLDSVRDDLAAVAEKALEPAHMSVWIRAGERR